MACQVLEARGQLPGAEGNAAHPLFMALRCYGTRLVVLLVVGRRMERQACDVRNCHSSRATTQRRGRVIVETSCAMTSLYAHVCEHVLLVPVGRLIQPEQDHGGPRGIS